jgi:drug/metabolite transporter (DMT)-like permease
MMAELERHKALGFGACALASSLWGCGFFFGKIALVEMGFAHMVLYRFLFAMVALLPLLVTHRPGLNMREWGLLAVTAFLGVPLQFLVQFHGLSLTTVSHASLMVGTLPVILAVGAAVFAHERMDGVGWAALVASTCGAAMIALGGRHGASDTGGASLAGDLLVVLSLVIALFWILLNKRLMARHSPVVVTAYGALLGTLMLSVWVPVRYGMPPLAGVSTKAWMALAASGVLLNMEPLIGSLLGVLVLGERLGPSAWLGGGLILAAAVTLTTHSKTRVRGESEAQPELMI